MARGIRRNDILRLSAIAPVAQKIPATLFTNDPAYLGFINDMPEWLFPLSLGFAVAVWLLDPWTSDSRLKQIWRGLTRVADVIFADYAEWPDQGQRSVYITYQGRSNRREVWLQVRCSGEFVGETCFSLAKAEKKNLFLNLGPPHTPMENGIHFEISAVANHWSVIEVSLASGLRRQTDTFRVNVPWSNSGSGARAVVVRDGDFDG